MSSRRPTKPWSRTCPEAERGRRAWVHQQNRSQDRKDIPGGRRQGIFWSGRAGGGEGEWVLAVASSHAWGMPLCHTALGQRKKAAEGSRGPAHCPVVPTQLGNDSPGSLFSPALQHQFTAQNLYTSMQEHPLCTLESPQHWKANYGPRCAAGHMHSFEKLLLRCSWSPDGTKVTCGSADRMVRAVGRAVQLWARLLWNKHFIFAQGRFLTVPVMSSIISSLPIAFQERLASKMGMCPQSCVEIICSSIRNWVLLLCLPATPVLSCLCSAAEALNGVVLITCSDIPTDMPSIMCSVLRLCNVSLKRFQGPLGCLQALQ